MNQLKITAHKDQIRLSRYLRTHMKLRTHKKRNYIDAKYHIRNSPEQSNAHLYEEHNRN